MNQYIGARIISVDNEEVRNVQEVLGAFEKIHPGDTVVLKVSKSEQVNEVKIQSTNSNAQTNAAIAYFMLSNKGCTMQQNNEKVFISFSSENAYSSYNDQNDLINLGQKKVMNSQALFQNNWIIAAAGIISDQTNQIWIVKDMADLGMVLRLCGTTGISDMILFKAGADPANEDNYVRKRFVLSGRNFIYQQTLWY